MFNRQKPHKKTCWSIVTNLLSDVSPTKLLLGYLYISGQVLNSFAKPVTETFYYRKDLVRNEPSSTCVNAAPDCFLNVKSLFTEGKLNGFEVHQSCVAGSPQSFDDMYKLNQFTLRNQIKSKQFFGNRVCDGVVTNTKDFQYKNPINTVFADDTDYSVKIIDEDRVTITYSKS